MARGWRFYYFEKAGIGLSVDLIFRIAAIGIVVAVLSQLLGKAGRDDMATMVAIAGLVIVLVMVIGVISDLFESVKSVFNLY